MDPSTFLSALLAIIVIDLVLAGDNAIVIALAARALPAHLQRRAIAWGALGAIGVRSLMTVVVVWLLKIPGLQLAGGLLLAWIAYRLLVPDEDPGDERTVAAATFWGAMRTIVVADAVMGLDNVLAVAGAAHGSYLLVVCGLVISVPIVVWGSTVVLKLVERYPGVVYLGAAVLVWTAAKMVTTEPSLQQGLVRMPWLRVLAFLAVPLVLWIGFLRNHRRLDSRIHARLREFARHLPQPPDPFSPHQGDRSMLKVLVPIDGSRNALRALSHVITEYRRHRELELHLLNVQPRLSRHIGRFIRRSDRDAWHHDQAQAALADAQAMLAEAGVPYQAHRALGDRALEICRIASDLAVHHIVIGTARKNSLTRMLEDSTTNRVLEATPVPVEVVAGESVSLWERWGLPAGVLGLGGLVLLALD